MRLAGRVGGYRNWERESGRKIRPYTYCSTLEILHAGETTEADEGIRMFVEAMERS